MPRKATKRRTSRTIRTPRTKWEMLRVLQKFLASAEPWEANEVWSILTALRGPDNGSRDSLDIKEATTAIIRAHVLGPTNARQGRFGMVYNDNDARANQRGRASFWSDKYYHFRCHARSAFTALGLSWGAVNPPAEDIK